MSITNHSTWHTHKRHTQNAVTSKLPRDSNAHITSKALHMTTVSLILRASTKPIPCDTRELARCCGDEVVNVLPVSSFRFKSPSLLRLLFVARFPSSFVVE